MRARSPRILGQALTTRRLLLALSLLACGVYAATFALPSLLLAAGVGGSAMALARRSAWSPLSALAGGVLVAAACWAAALVVLGNLDHGGLSAAESYLVLALPLVVAAVIAATARADASSTVSERVRGEQYRFFIPLLVVATGVVLSAGLLELTVDGLAEAWTMSGDGRNHVLLARSVVAEGGIGLSRLRTYPILFNGLVAVHATATGRPVSEPGALLEQDISSLAALYVLCAALLAALLAVAAAQVVTSRDDFDGSGAGAWIVAGTAGALVLTPLVLGTALLDGYFTGVAGLVLLLATIVTAVQAVGSASVEAALVTAGAALLLLTVWPLLALVASPVAAVAGLAVLRRGRARPASMLAAGACLASAAGPPAVFYHARATVGPTLLLTGPNTRPSAALLIVLGALLAASYVLLGPASAPALTVAAVAGASGVAVLAFLVTLGEQPTFWGYYSGKTLWLLESALLYLLLVPAAALGLRRGLLAAGPQAAAGRRGAGAASFAAAALAVTAMATPLPSPLKQAAEGWMTPGAAVAQEMVDRGDGRSPYVFWRWDNPLAYGGEDRLANFWAFAVWAVTPGGENRYQDALPGGPVTWGYESGSGTTEEICRLAVAVPGLTILTRHPSLADEMRASCPTAVPEVVVEQVA